MGGRNFRQMLEACWAEGKFVCVGLDSNSSRIPTSIVAYHAATRILLFNQHIVEATYDTVCAFKPNTAFYEAQGADGWLALQQTIAHIHYVAPQIPVILDAKRADIGSTNAGYVEMAFDFLKADAITVHPYLGAEALQPFLARAEKGIIVLCRTSNLGAGEFQDLSVNGEPLYRFVARRVTNEWNKNGNCALVVGATYPDELREVRGIVGDMPILIPGIGAQGGDVEKTVSAGKDSRGRGMIINSSRGTIFASSGPDFAEASRKATIRLHEQIQACLG